MPSGNLGRVPNDEDASRQHGVRRQIHNPGRFNPEDTDVQEEGKLTVHTYVFSVV